LGSSDRKFGLNLLGLELEFTLGVWNRALSVREIYRLGDYYLGNEGDCEPGLPSNDPLDVPPELKGVRG